MSYDVGEKGHREWNFRALLRVLLATHHTTKEALLAICPDGEKLSSYLTFLHDQDMLLHTKHAYTRGPALAGIQDIGHTLEWWSAEWLRRSFASQGLLPVRHGVTLTEMIREGDTGDLDVVAFPGNALMIMECKSSLLQVDSMTLNLFLWRASLLEPDLALLLIDASPSQCKKVLAKVQRRLASWQIPPVEGHDEQGIHWNAGNPVMVTGPAGQSVHWDTGNIYAALSTEQNSLERVLETVLHHYQMHHA